MSLNNVNKTIVYNENGIECKIRLLGKTVIDVVFSTNLKYTPREFIRAATDLIIKALNHIRSCFNNEGIISFWIEILDKQRNMHRFNTEFITLKDCIPTLLFSELMNKINRLNLCESDTTVQYLILDSNST